jgi:hypothetical protein
LINYFNQIPVYHETSEPSTRKSKGSPPEKASMDRIELGSSWKLRRLADGSERPIEVPGDILNALLTAGGGHSRPVFRPERAEAPIGGEGGCGEAGSGADSYLRKARVLCCAGNR